MSMNLCESLCFDEYIKPYEHAEPEIVLQALAKWKQVWRDYLEGKRRDIPHEVHIPPTG